MVADVTRDILLLCCPIPGSPERPLSPTEYANLGQVPAERLAALRERGDELDALLERWERRGIWVIGRGDERYPSSLERRLGRRSPPLLYGMGNADLLAAPGIAVVGPREAGPDALRFAAEVARQAVGEGLSVISGAARGVDAAAMDAALEAGGPVVGVLPGGLARMRRFRPGRRLCLVTACAPHVGFSSGVAMSYCLSGLVVVADSGVEGRTWGGAVEGLKRGWGPVFVRRGEGEGSARLVQLGARWFPEGTALRRLLSPEESTLF